MSNESSSVPPASPTPGPPAPPGSERASDPRTLPKRSRAIWSALVLVPLLLAGTIWIGNDRLVGSPVAAAIARDSRNDGYDLDAHYGYYVSKGTLVLDLESITSAAPVDLLRGLFVAADTLSKLDRAFEKVILARAGVPIFLLEGEDFLEIGREYGAGQNPVYLIRTFPEKLYRASDGQKAYGTWEGGFLGVTIRQMEDVSDAALAWTAGGERTP